MTSPPTAPSAHWPIVERPEMIYPNGCRMALYLGLNLEYFEFGKPSISRVALTAGLPIDPLNHAWREYGNRVGFWRMLDGIDHNQLPVSLLINSEAATRFPEIVKAGRERNWAFLGHGRTNSELWVGFDEDGEREAIAKIVQTLTETTGKSPQGWLGPALSETENTLRLLAEAGFRYSLDWVNDDQPYPLPADGRPFASIPYSIEINDIPAFIDDGKTGDQFAQMIVDQFEVLHAESQTRPGAVMCLALHPFVSGHPFRYKHLAAAMEAISGFDDVWYANTDEIADWYFSGPYEQAVKELERRGR